MGRNCLQEIPGPQLFIDRDSRDMSLNCLLMERHGPKLFTDEETWA